MSQQTEPKVATLYRSKLKRNGNQDNYNLDRPTERPCCGGSNSECIINPKIYSTQQPYLIGRPFMSSDAPVAPEYFPDAPSVTTRRVCPGTDHYDSRPSGNKYDLMEQPFRFEANRDASNFYKPVENSTRLEAADRAKESESKKPFFSRRQSYAGR